MVDADGTIVVGHTRYKAALALEMAEVPVVVASDLTPEQCAAYRLADNRVGELAEWDMDLLAQELDGLADLDMSAFGFGEDISSMEFMDFDGLGDGGGSRMQTGDKVRVVIGPAMFDIADPTHELYDACRDMDTERAGEFIERAIREGRAMRLCFPSVFRVKEPIPRLHRRCQGSDRRGSRACADR